MDSQPFVDSFRCINSSYLKLIDSLSALRALSTMTSNFSSDQALLDGALNVLVENQDLERCCIYLVQGDELINVAGVDWNDMISVDHGLPRRSQRGTVFALGEGVVGLAALTGQLQHCRDCQQDTRFMARPETADSIKQGCAVVGSLICVPISNGEQVLGVLNVSHPHPHFFDEGHERSLRIFSNVLGQMLVNNRLLHQMEERVRERTQQLQQALEDAEELRHRYETLSTVDDLTQLHNRRFFFPESRTALARCMRKKQPYAMLLLDVDHFKEVNDNYGHATGDLVLRDVAGLIKQQLREGDIVARFGGEEFVVALPDTDGDGAMVLAERIREAVKQDSWQVDRRKLSVTVSIGISDVAEHAEKDSQKLLDRLIMEADQALYFGKHHGRDQCQSHAAIACKL
ncbi:MAG: diguanylate cyclase [Thiohalomonadaceae bacterium]